jgi:hypothetical protein
MPTLRLEKETGELPAWRQAILWLLFFFICLGLGYPTLSRFDPGKGDGPLDPGAYAAMVTGAPLSSIQQDLGHRVLVPYLAKPVYWLVKNHLGTWSPAYFALLVVNSIFVASTAWMLGFLGRTISGDYTVALVASFVYMGNFVVPNLHLSGYVDSPVDFVLIGIAWSLIARRWWTLPLWIIPGALSKETFVPLALVFTLAWYAVEFRNGARSLSRLVWIGIMAVVGYAVLSFVMSHQPTPYSPLSFAHSRQMGSIADFLFLPGLMRCLRSHELLFGFAWLLPLGLPRLKRLPAAWTAAAISAALVALAMGAYDDALGNAVRPMFSCAGPLLSLSVAMFISGAPVRGAKNASA